MATIDHSQSDSTFEDIAGIDRRVIDFEIRLLVYERLLLRIAHAYCVDASIMGGLDIAQALRRELLAELSSGDVDNDYDHLVKDRVNAVAGGFFQRLELAVKK